MCAIPLNVYMILCWSYKGLTHEYGQRGTVSVIRGPGVTMHATHVMVFREIRSMNRDLGFSFLWARMEGYAVI